MQNSKLFLLLILSVMSFQTAFPKLSLTKVVPREIRKPAFLNYKNKSKSCCKHGNHKHKSQPAAQPAPAPEPQIAPAIQPELQPISVQPAPAAQPDSAVVQQSAPVAPIIQPASESIPVVQQAPDVQPVILAIESVPVVVEQKIEEIAQVVAPVAPIAAAQPVSFSDFLVNDFSAVLDGHVDLPEDSFLAAYIAAEQDCFECLATEQGAAVAQNSQIAIAPVVQELQQVAAVTPAAQAGLQARMAAWLKATQDQASGFAQNTWAQLPTRQQLGVMATNACDESWFQLTAPGGYVRQHPVIVGASVAAAVAVTTAGYYAYSKGYFGKAYKSVKARLSQKN